MSFKQKASLIMRGFFILTSLYLFISCTSFPAEKDRGPSWESITKDIYYVHGRTAYKRLKYYALRIDLSSPDIQIVVKGGAAGENEENFLSAKVSSFVRNNNLTAGINAVPFDVSSAKEGQAIKNAGIVVSQGKLLSPANHNYDALVFYKDGKAAIVSQASIDSAAMEDIINAAGGFHQILKDGEPTERTLNSKPRHPRSAAGISANGRYLYLLVIDGRQAASKGATEEETALVLSALGSWNGINLDGGGSSALALRFPDSNVKVVNKPVHKIIPGQERAVAGCIGVSPSKER